MGAQFFKDIESIGVGQHHVEQHQIGNGRTAQCLEDLGAIGGHPGFKPLHAEKSLQQLCEAGFILDNHDGQPAPARRLSFDRRAPGNAHVIPALLQGAQPVAGFPFINRLAAILRHVKRTRPEEVADIYITRQGLAGNGRQPFCDEISHGRCNRIRWHGLGAAGDLRHRRTSIHQYEEFQLGGFEESRGILQFLLASRGRSNHIARGEIKCWSHCHERNCSPNRTFTGAKQESVSIGHHGRTNQPRALPRPASF